MNPQNNPDPVKPSTAVDRTIDRTIVDIDRPGSAGARPVPEMSRGEVVAAADAAVRTIAPLWPLETFVAVNPFLGIANLPYADADNTVDRIWGARLVMPRSFYAEAIRDGRIERRHIAEALNELEDSVAGDHSVDSVYLLAFTEEPASFPTPTVAEVLSNESGKDWHGFVTDRISFWAAGHFDEGQASWRSPWRELTPYAAWRGEAELDQTPEIIGIPDFRGIVRTLPADADEMLLHAARTLGLRGDVFSTYLLRLLATIAGWAGHARFRGWQKELAGGSDERVKGLLAIRAAWDLALLDAFEAEYPDTGEVLRQRLTTPLHPDVAKSHVVNLILHTAFEVAGREPLLGALADSARPAASDAGSRPAEDETRPRPNAQAVFCIDVRSERYRRSLERVGDGVETMGFAGFFGFALEVAPIDRTDGGAQCPVLLTPQYLVRETAAGASAAQVARLERKTWLGRRLAAAWKQFGVAAISSFAFVESLGLAFGWKLLADSLGLDLRGKPARFTPSLEGAQLGSRVAGIPIEKRIELARGVLAGMSLVDGFARIVALIGHGSTTANNPYASRLNCGACGGHTGEANALVAAQVLNDADVRRVLRHQGVVDIPSDTLFVAGLHDTTTDVVSLLLPHGVPDSHRDDIENLDRSLADAGRANRRERAATFGLPTDGSADKAVVKRSRDWSEVRPEWGLAGCMAFIAAPRERTREIDLGGRSFLHSYDWQGDESFEVLELIMTAPLIVASWISLQYYASTVDNRVFGSGDKTLHNVVGGLGVLEGNGGDLRVGLPLQSLHDGERYMHRPMRLNAFIEAPLPAINAVLEKHEHLRDLAENGWLHLFAILDEGKTVKRYSGDMDWSDVDADQRPAAREAANAPARRSA